jgi:hypothetical protein
VGKLAPLVRCPHLSQFWLSASVLSDTANKLLLRGLKPQLQQLLLLNSGCSSTAAALSFDDFGSGVPVAPASWLLPERDIQPISRAQVEWEVDVAAIRQAAQNSASQKRTVELKSPASCLLGGIMWHMLLQCVWDNSKQGSTVGLFAAAKSLPAGTICRCMFSLECAGVDVAGDIVSQRPAHGTRLFKTGSGGGWGVPDFFKVGCMPGGFDEAAWAAKGLPASGTIQLRLTVSDVGV